MEPMRDMLVRLIREAFEGEPTSGAGTWFTEDGQTLDPLLDSLTADQASTVVGPGLHSVAAHAGHVQAFLAMANAFARGENPVIDWDSTWSKSVVNETEWQALRQSLRHEGEEFCGNVAQFDFESNPEALPNVMGITTHLAYHVGAIRQLSHMT